MYKNIIIFILRNDEIIAIKIKRICEFFRHLLYKKIIKCFEIYFVNYHADCYLY